MSKPKLYANGYTFNQVRELEINEAPNYLDKLTTDNLKYRLHRRSAQFVFYGSLFIFSLALLFSLLPGFTLSDTAVIPIAFCLLAPSLTGIFQEVFFGFNKYVRAIFFIPLILIAACFFPTAQFILDTIFAPIILIFFTAGLIMLILRWFDAKRLYPLTSKGLHDFYSGQIFVFKEIDNEGNEYKLEILPTSHMIYSFMDEISTSWESADVVEISNTSPNEFLAPWYFSPTTTENDEIRFYQRSMSEKDLVELSTIRQNFLRRSLVLTLPSLYLTALLVRFFENLINWNTTPELSLTGWLITLFVGLLFPARYFLNWLKLKSDQNSKIIVSIWEMDEKQCRSKLLEEFLQESHLLWSQEDRPSYWRVSTNLNSG